MNKFESIQAYCNAVSELAPYKVGWAIGSLDVETLRSFRSAGKRERCYKEFEIPKKSGGVRRITAPTGTLKDIMSCTADLLSEIYVPSDAAMGFIAGRSVKTNAEAHLGKCYVLNLDLSDFFPSIDSWMVESALVRYGVEALTARLIATICCYPKKDEDGKIRNVLPQGAPTSPVLSNMVCRSLDFRLQGLADYFLLKYTRYADDLTFSSNHHVYDKDGEFFAELRRIISGNGFTINEAKTRLLVRWHDRREVTGLTVGEKVNVSRKWLKNLRAAMHHLEKIHIDAAALRRVEGKVNYLGMIKGKEDPTYRRLRNRLRRVKYLWKQRQKALAQETAPFETE